MKKKKLVALGMVAAMATTAVVGGSLAYFTDKESAVNEFTLGNVKIDLVEEQRNADGTALEEFKDNKVLLPIVGSAQGEKEEVGGYHLPTAANWVDKIVTVDNEGSQPAYVRVLYAFPADMDDKEFASEMMLHRNWDGSEASGTWSRTDANVTITIGGKAYNVYNDTYLPVLAAKGDVNGKDTTSSPSMTGVYIDSRVNATVDANGNITYSMINKDEETVSAIYAKGTAPKLLVLTQGVQAAGFENANDALNAGFGAITVEKATEWFNAVVNNKNTNSKDDRADIK